MTDIMTVGGNSLRAFSRGLATVSDNVANAQTPGYARRRVDQISGEIVRLSDDWRHDEARVALGTAAQAASRLGWLEAAETALADGPGGVGQRVGAVFNSATELAADPQNNPRRSAFLQAVADAATAFRASATGLKSVAEGIAIEGQTAVDDLNSNLSALRDINQTLLATAKGTTASASLLDQRDRLLDRVAQSVAVNVSLDDRGIATLNLSGSGETILTAAKAGAFDLTVAGTGALSFSVTDIGGTSGAYAPSGGQLAGLASASTDVAGQRASLDALATKFADVLNTAQSVGRRNDGAAGGPLINLGSQAALTIAALDLGPADLAVADASSQNGNIVALTNGRSASAIETGWVALVTDQAQRVSSAKLLQETTQARSDAASEARDNASGVDLDQEAVDLLRYQQSFDAAARVIQTAREILQTILNIAR